MISASVAEKCYLVFGQELSDGEEAEHADLAFAAKVKELEAWKHFGVFRPMKGGGLRKAAPDTRWVLASEMVKGAENC